MVQSRSLIGKSQGKVDICCVVGVWPGRRHGMAQRFLVLCAISALPGHGGFRKVVGVGPFFW